MYKRQLLIGMPEVLDALTGSNSLRYTLDIGVDAVRRDFFRLTVAIHIVVVGIDQLTHSAVDRQVTDVYKRQLQASSRISRTLR